MAVIISHYGKIVTAFLCMKKTERGESPIHKAPSQPMDKIQAGGILMYYVSYTKDGKDFDFISFEAAGVALEIWNRKLTGKENTAFR